MKNIKSIVLSVFVVAALASCRTKQNVVQSEERTTNQRSEKQGRKGGPPSIEKLFEMDTNGDGYLAKSEVRGRILERFDIIDANKDGLLSKEEVKNAPKPNRKGRGAKG